MQPSFWKALEKIGTDGAALADWHFLLGADKANAESFLRPLHHPAETVLDPDRPSRRLKLYPEAKDFLGVAEEPPLRTPLPVTKLSAAMHGPDWRKIGAALGPLLGFVAADWKGSGQTRQVGIIQAQRRIVRPVYLHIPTGTVSNGLRLLHDMGKLCECVLLVPSARWLNPQVMELAQERQIQVEALAERFAQTPENRGSLLARSAEAPTIKQKPSKQPALLDVQPGWLWDNLQMEVNLRGIMMVRYGQQRGEYQFPKQSGRGYSQGIEILGKIAVAGFWENPHSGASDHEKSRKAFRRLAHTIRRLIPIPGEPFELEGRQWKPLFKLKLDRTVKSLRMPITSSTK